MGTDPQGVCEGCSGKREGEREKEAEDARGETGNLLVWQTKLLF